MRKDDEKAEKLKHRNAVQSKDTDEKVSNIYAFIPNKTGLDRFQEVCGVIALIVVNMCAQLVDKPK